MGSNAATGGSNTADERRQDTYSDQYNKLKKEEARKSKYKTDKFGYKVKKNPVERYMDNSFITNNPFSKKSEEINRKYFEETVKPAGKSKYNNYEDYIRARGRGEVDAYGREITSTGGGNDNQVVQAPLEATTMPVETPSSIEVAEPVMTAEEARAKASDLIKKKRRGKGRDTLIATSPQGVTNEGLTLSEKSLLG